VSQGRAQERFGLVLRLLDHQLVGPSGGLLGNVDNLVVAGGDSDLVVTGLISGPAGLGPRLPGHLGRWMLAIWRRLHPDAEPRPLVVPMSHVRRISSSVAVSDWAETLLGGTAGFEMWLRRYVIARIPGATGGEDRLAGEPVTPVTRRPEFLLPQGSQLVSDLIGAAVVDAQGVELGRVVEIGVLAIEQTGLEVGRLRIVDVEYGRRHVGGRLGITAHRAHGPHLLGQALRAWHRGDRRVPVADVEGVDWQGRRVTLKAGARVAHPLVE
jgi:hypothetical protein